MVHRTRRTFDQYPEGGRLVFDGLFWEPCGDLPDKWRAGAGQAHRTTAEDVRTRHVHHQAVGMVGVRSADDDPIVLNPDLLL